ncbi:MAG: ABC transporter permease [Ferruginibacter sp.]|nr:ABC transporter permease [Cytophagales bacterium]
MNLSRFIAQRIRQTTTASFSATVTRVGVASIAIGLAVMILSFAILGGFKGVIMRKIFSFGAHIQVTKFTMNNSYEETPVSTNADLYQKFKPGPRLQHIQVFGHKAGMLQSDQEIMGAVLKGVGRDYNWSAFRQTLVAGDILAFPDSGSTASGGPSYSNQILVSRRIANKLRVRPGDKVTMYFIQNPPRARPLVVKGIYETGLEELDNTLIIGDIGLVQRLNDWSPDQVGGFEVFVNGFNGTDLHQLDQAYQEVDERMDQDMGGSKITDRYLSLFDWLSLLNRNVVVFLTLILFVACFNMVSILLILMMERTAMIGMLKAMGATDWQIRRIFLYNGISLVWRGLLFGNLLGVGLCALQYHFRLIPLDPVNYFMDTVPIEWNWPVFGLLNLATLVVVSAVLVIPTFIVTRIQPIRAIAFAK